MKSIKEFDYSKLKNGDILELYIYDEYIGKYECLDTIECDIKFVDIININEWIYSYQYENPDLFFKIVR